MRIDSVLIANRGEIAVRVIRACHTLGLRSVALFTDADEGALHTRLAAAALPVASYLDIEAVLDTATAAGVDAVHPGYGLLAENAAFAAAVRDKGMAFAGPPAEVVATMGDKLAARAVAVGCGVPVLPGTEGPVDAEDPSLPALAEQLGWPLLVKAAHGGGGRGMRVAAGPAELAEALRSAAREATAAFGRGEVFLERYLARPRHVEVQVLADSGGQVLVLGDRDCSVQRRHQKLIEEAPAPALPDDVRAGMHQAALRLATEVGYLGAGTVEFLFDPARGEFAFLEMNTRLQVEHGVTELVTGVDLVAAQLRIAAGEPLDVPVAVNGHAIQARIAAEDPAQDFRPAPGGLGALELPGGPGVRCDFGYRDGDRVPGEYDSLLGKVHAWAPTRDAARARLAGALDELVVTGVPTTAGYLRGVLDRPDFAAAEHDTGSVQRDWPPEPADAPPPAQVPGDPVRTVRLSTDRGPLVLRVQGRARSTAQAAAAPRATRSQAQSSSGADPVAPMDATVVSVAVTAGERVSAGDVLVVLEAMKMELPVRAAADAEVHAVHAAEGDTVRAGTRLVDLA